MNKSRQGRMDASSRPAVTREGALDDRSSAGVDRLDFIPENAANGGQLLPFVMQPVAFASAQTMRSGETPSTEPGLRNSIVSTEQVSIPWSARDQFAEQQQNSLLLMLLQQQEVQAQQQQVLLHLGQQRQENQHKAFIAATLASSRGASLLPLATNLSSQLLETSGSAMAARAALEHELISKLTSQAQLWPGAIDSTEQQIAMPLFSGKGSSAPLLTDVADLTTEAKGGKLPNDFDASNLPDPSSDGDDREEESGGSTFTGDAAAKEKFPSKLYRMLDDVEKNGDSSVVSFFSHGRAFAVHKPRDFVADLMPKYFSTTRISSFQRQLNLYGFRRITAGRDKGGYFHEYFLRGRKSLCKKILRKKSTLQAKPSESAEAGSNTGDLGNTRTAVSGNTFSQAILASLNQQILSQRAAPPTQHLTQASIDFILGATRPQRSGLGGIDGSRNVMEAPEIMGLERFGLGIPGAIAMMGASERLQQRRSDLTGPMLHAQQLQRQVFAMHEQAQYGYDSEHSS